MDRKENIRNAYRLTGSNNFYDGMITCSTVLGKAVCRLVWDMGKEECGEYLNQAFTGVLEDFAGKLLEVPVGTGILRCRSIKRCRAPISPALTTRLT